MAEVSNLITSHLAGQFERGLAILFTGAGFSLNAKNMLGTSVPSYGDLRRQLWNLCFSGKPIDENCSLQDLYTHAQLRHPGDLKELLSQQLTVDPDSLPDFYGLIFSMPWFRIYTLNIDDLESAASRKFDLPRPINTISATARVASGIPSSSSQAAQHLDMVHLNGTIADLPDNVTFSTTQYAERLSRPEPWYVACAANLLSHSVVFIGTRLDEPSLWQHIELRRLRGSREMRELRPRSYLVSPNVDLPRQALLSEFNVHWLPMTLENFAEQVLGQLHAAARSGIAYLGSHSRTQSGASPIPEVSNLARNPMQGSEFLLGQEPIWADLQSGRAIHRESDDEVWALLQKRMSAPTRGLVIITGTAGSGKSTALMRAALRMTAEGVHVGWLDRESELSPREVRVAMKADGAPSVLILDDGDLFGGELANLVRELALHKSNPLVVVGVRAGKLDRVLNPTLLAGVPTEELSIPHLTDNDIDGLLDVLDRENRLGVLKGKSKMEQTQLFRIQAGRQLLVAMIQATSGVPFKEKAVEELDDLPPEGRNVYSLICVASAFRFSLQREDILVASGDRTNTALNITDELVGRHIVATTPWDGSIRARHRVIADLILDELKRTGELKDILTGLTFLAATKVNPATRRSDRASRMLRSLINHEFLAHTIYPEAARNLYGSIEQLLSWDFHYWLQRGALEVEFGDVALAENFLNQAKGLEPDDPYVLNEWAYLLFRKAIENVTAREAPEFVAEATGILEDLIEEGRNPSAYPYHVLGSQGLSWARRGIVDLRAKQEYISKLVKHVEDGYRAFPRATELEQLLKDLKREELETVVAHNKDQH